MRGLLVAVGVALLVGGCGGRAARGPGHGPPGARADRLYAEGRYAEAARAYEEELARHPDDPGNQAVLLRLGILYLVHGAPERDPARGEATLRRLVRDYPDGELRETAQYILALRDQIEALDGQVQDQRRRIGVLERQIESLKRIDIKQAPDRP